LSVRCSPVLALALLCILLFLPAAAGSPASPRADKYRVALTGDSRTNASLGYGGYARAQLKYLADVYIKTTYGNPEGYELCEIVDHLIDTIVPVAPDAVLFNTGLNALSCLASAGASEYENRKRRFADSVGMIIDTLREYLPSAKIAFATCLPVDDTLPGGGCGIWRLDAHVAEFNALAVEVCATAGVPVCDLYTLAKDSAMTRTDGRHYIQEDNTVIGRYVADFLRLLLEGGPVVRIQSFSCRPGTVALGEGAWLGWRVLDATGVQLNGKDVSATGDLFVQPDETTAYTLLCEGPVGPIEETLHLHVSQGLASAIQIEPSAATIAPGSSIVFTARAVDAASLTLPSRIAWEALGDGISVSSAAEHSDGCALTVDSSLAGADRYAVHGPDSGSIFRTGDTLFLCFSAPAREYLNDYNAAISIDAGLSFFTMPVHALQDGMAFTVIPGYFDSDSGPVAPFSETCLVRISDYADGSVFGVSEPHFSIRPPASFSQCTVTVAEQAPGMYEVSAYIPGTDTRTYAAVYASGVAVPYAGDCKNLSMRLRANGSVLVSGPRGDYVIAGVYTLTGKELAREAGRLPLAIRPAPPLPPGCYVVRVVSPASRYCRRAIRFR
ncbi:MAG: hypothetical protein GF418_10705, partial [Chitinivibrionales bacterium]|nr:hypothetical protein [Chitinivibrionales bacterium]MBD3396084.1 hypothetical protein [Chitinivibrionales bacterium]